MEISVKDFAQFHREQQLEWKQKCLTLLLDAKEAENWEEFITIALTRYEVMPEAFTFYEQIPDNLKYNFAISAYMHHGDSLPAVRKAVRSALKYGAPVLPPEIAAQETITIYRAGEEDITKCKYRISWSTDINTALFFLNTYGGRHANYLYKGQIKTADIIAYTNERKENEIMQYNKVFNIELLQTYKTTRA